MITNIKGKIIKIGVDWMDIDLGPIALRINVPNSSISTLGKTGDTITLFTKSMYQSSAGFIYRYWPGSQCISSFF